MRKEPAIKEHALSVEPKSIDDAQARIDQLTCDIRMIELQLSNRNVVDSSGERVTGKEYWAWRNKAMTAYKAKLNEKQLLKQWIKTEKNKIDIGRQRLALKMSGTIDANDPAQIMWYLYNAIKRAQKEDRFSPRQEDYTILDVAQDYLSGQDM